MKNKQDSKLPLRLCAIVVFALSLAGCSGDSDDDESEAGDPDSPSCNQSVPESLTSGASISNLCDYTGAVRTFTIDVPAGASQLLVTTRGGAGDADLSVYGPDELGVYLVCDSDDVGNDETCSISSPNEGTWEIEIEAYEAYSGLTLTATISAPAAPAAALTIRATDPLQNGEWLIEQAARKGVSTIYALSVPEGTGLLEVESMGNAGNADLYVLGPNGSLVCSETASSSDESCTVELPASGSWSVELHGVDDYENVMLRATYR